MAVSLPQGAVNELHADEREHKKDCDEQQHQHNAEGDYTLLSSFASDVPRHAPLRSMKQLWPGLTPGPSLIGTDQCFNTEV